MGFFGLFKKKPIKPKAPQFAPPSSPNDKPPDLLDEFPEHEPVVEPTKESLSEPPKPPPQDNPLADVSDEDFSTPSTAEPTISSIPESTPPISSPGTSTPDNSGPELPDFSSDEIDVARQLEEQAKTPQQPIDDSTILNQDAALEDEALPDIPGIAPPGERESDAEQKTPDWSKPLEQITPVMESVSQWPQPSEEASSTQMPAPPPPVSLPEESSTQLQEETPKENTEQSFQNENDLPDFTADPQNGAVDSHSDESWDVPPGSEQAPSINDAKEALGPKNLENPSDDSTLSEESVPSDSNPGDNSNDDSISSEELDLSDESIQTDDSMLSEVTDTINSKEESLPAFAEDTTEQTTNDSQDTSDDALPVAPTQSEEHKPWVKEPLPAFDASKQVTIPENNEMYLPVLQYRDALDLNKEIKSDLKKSNNHLTKTIKDMSQNKATFSDFAEDLRAIEVDLLRMDEVLR